MLYCYCHLQEDLRRLSSEYPDFLVRTIGYTCLGRPIFGFKLGEGAKQIFYSGAMHANESITAKLLMLFTEKLLHWSTFSDNGSMLNDNTCLWIVPMVNPDGVELVSHGLAAVSSEYQQRVLEINGYEGDFNNWKANIRGVDLNDQFPAFWEEEVDRRDAIKPGPANYPGLEPLSEPESIALADFTLAQQFDLAVAWHSQGEEIYWGYRALEPPQSEFIAEKMAKASGYRAVQYVESDAGYKDWFIMRFGQPGFTVECGLGKNPLPVEEADAIMDKCWGILLAGLKA